MGERLKLSGAEMWTVAVTGLCLAAMLVCFGLGGQTAPLEPRPAAGPAAEAESAAPAGRVDINTAGKSLLMTLPGIGEERALAIIRYRRANGPFRYVEELLQVPGIGPGTVEKLRDYATVGGQSHGKNTGG